MTEAAIITIQIVKINRMWRWDPMNFFHTAIFLYLSQARTWISNVICHGLFFVFNDVMREVILRCFFVDITGLVL